MRTAARARFAARAPSWRRPIRVLRSAVHARAAVTSPSIGVIVVRRIVLERETREAREPRRARQRRARRKRVTPIRARRRFARAQRVRLALRLAW